MENSQISNSGSSRTYYKYILTTGLLLALAASTTYLLFQNKRQKDMILDHARAINELHSVINNNHLMINFNDYLNSVFNDRKFSFPKFFYDIENQMSELRRNLYKNHLNGKAQIVSNEKECMVTAALPGFSKEEILITLFNNNLEIIAQHSAKNDSDNENNKDIADKQIQEKIKYTIAVPVNIDRNNITAQLKNGLLTVKFLRIATQVNTDSKEILID